LNWDAIGAIAEALGAIGVIATLIYLSKQIRHNSKTIQAQMYQARTQMSEDRYGDIADSQYLAPIYTKLESEHRPFDPARVCDLTPEELTRLRLSEQRWLRGIDNAFHQHSLGFIPDDDFLDEIRRMVGRRYDLWKEIKVYSVRDAFREFIEDAVNRPDERL
jgi:hypothetical protein